MTKKTLYTKYSQVPWQWKYLNVMLIWLFLMPIGVVLMWSGDVYYNKVKDGKLVKMSVNNKIATTIQSLFVMAALLVRAYTR